MALVGNSSVEELGQSENVGPKSKATLCTGPQHVSNPLPNLLSARTHFDLGIGFRDHFAFEHPSHSWSIPSRTTTVA